MRKAQKQKILDLITSLHQVHEEIRKALEQNNLTLAQDMISTAQESAISLGENIEKTEGEGHITVSGIEGYCELLFHIFEGINKNDVNTNKVYKVLRKQLIKIENSVKNDIAVRLEVAFFPYKASMWDSLESVYLAAKKDPECDAYCVPIPYYTLNPDRSFGQMHYEGGEYPEEIEIIDWEKYDFEDRRPDVIYIHNPYDGCNLVTSVHPRYYSSNLKKYTDTLVYIPYYVTSGGMMEAQSMLPAYLYADYIVIQSPQFRKQFDKGIPDEKFLPFGSPKVDKVINKCKNPPEPPEEWTEKMKGKDGKRKRVYFYNTSINGMLADTETFLKKMRYVFECFEGREDVCLLWRPHPLLETTFHSMRSQYWTAFEGLKKKFLDKGIGILDTTADIEDSIALSDTYIGDATTSVTALFGVAGKPVFILNDSILERSEESEWWKYINTGYNPLKQNRFAVVQGNKLYVSEPYQYNYKYFCDLTEGTAEEQYSAVYEIDGKWYACPSDAQNILLIGKNGIEKKIELEKRVAGRSMFTGSYKYDKYLLLIPLNYPSVVCYDTATGKVSYFTEHIDVFVKEINGERIRGCAWIFHGSLYIMSPTDNMVYKLDINSGRSSVIELPIQSRCGGDALLEYHDELWIVPREGRVIVSWNPETNKAREYTGFPDGFIGINPKNNEVCEEYLFSMPTAYGKYLYLPSGRSNMSLKLDMETGTFERWIPAFESEDEELVLKDCCAFLDDQAGKNKGDFKIYSFSRRKLYNINLKENICQEIKIQFDNMEKLVNSEAGGYEEKRYLPYACAEDYFNILDRFLQNRIVGNLFDREKQMNAYRKVNANCEGDCGEKVHVFIKMV